MTTTHLRYTTRPTRIRGPHEAFQRGDVVEVTARVIVPAGASPDQIAEWVARQAFGYGSLPEHNPLYGQDCTLLHAPEIRSAGFHTDKLDVIRGAIESAVARWREEQGERA